MPALIRCALGGAGLLAVLLAPSASMAADAGTAADTQLSRPANRLVDSNDPYLLLHAHNPVDWYPWGPEALAKAKRENKPIFVSIGYSTCYWCHVAERTIYSDPAIAALMNEWFVNIKVDREQRPDIDRIYLLATQTLIGRGGWPNNVFLTPDLKPFFAGSYFPPQDDAHGRPGFTTVLKEVHAAWTDRRAQVEQEAERVYAAMLSAQRQPASAPTAPVSPSGWLDRASAEILRSYDATHGGIGGGRTKFPRAPALELLLTKARSAQDRKALEALTRTLDAMALGGIHDHLGGGFHRYSTEPTWSIPHFEKMLYDNAQLLALYAQAYELTGNPLYRVAAQDAAAYLSQRMAAPGGGFYAAQDAEVDGVEGASYLWSKPEIEQLLGPEAAERFLQVYRLTPMPEQSSDNLMDGVEQGVLRVRAQSDARHSADEIVTQLASQAEARAKLLAARDARPQPARDEKIIVAWNALAIDALIRSGAILRNPAWIEAGKQAAAKLWTLAYDPKSRELKHEIYRGQAQTAGYLDDYALLGVAFLSLYTVTADNVWRDRAETLAASMLERFSKGGALVTTVATSGLLFALADDGDSTMPSGSSAALELLARLHKITGKAKYANSARQIMASLSGSVDQSPGLWSSAVATVNRHPQLAAATAAGRPRQASPVQHREPLGTAEVVHARGEARRAGDHVEIKVTVIVDKGYHINANPATFDYLIPTTLAIEGVTDLRIDYPAAILIKPRFAPDGLKVYEGTVTLRGAAPSLPEAKRIPAALKVQACDDRVCLPPATLAIRIQRK
jgi:uncharacterized protein